MIYTCTMDDRESFGVEASCAADAIQKALEEHRGHRVVQCHKGTPGAPSGFTDYEVPRHDPLPPKGPEEKPVDNQTGMFNEQEIRDESKRAHIRTAPQADS